MPFLELDDKTYLVDERGFLKEAKYWTEEFAIHLAKESEQGIPELTDQHWDLINGLRAYFLKCGRLPLVRHFCSEMRTKQHVLYELFPEGPYLGIAKIAGIPQSSKELNF